MLHILPSNVFTAWVHGAVLTLLAGLGCHLKPSAREPVFAHAWKESLRIIDASLSERVSIGAWDEKRLPDYHAVVAYGSDETLMRIRAQLPASVRWAGYGHKLSVGIVFRDALEGKAFDQVLDQVALDLLPFGMQGCLSPQILYVQTEAPLRWPALEARVDVMPRLKPFRELSDVVRELSALSPHLSSVGYAGAISEAALLEALRPTGLSRLCRLGQMQHPPLTWRNGGIFLPDILGNL